MPEHTELEAAVIAALDGYGLPYELIPCDPDLADTAAFCEHYGYPLEKSANTIIVASKREPKQFAPKLSFAKPDETAELTGMLLGGVTVLALPPDLPIYVDDAIVNLDYVILGGGSRSLKVKVSPELFRVMPQAQLVSDLTLAPRP